MFTCSRTTKLAHLLLLVSACCVGPGRGESQQVAVTRGAAGDGIPVDQSTIEQTSHDSAPASSHAEDESNFGEDPLGTPTFDGSGSGGGSRPKPGCSNPPAVQGAHIRLEIESVPGGVLLRVTYNCTDARIITGASVLTCGPHNDYTWRTEDTPTCEAAHVADDPHLDQDPVDLSVTSAAQPPLHTTSTAVPSTTAHITTILPTTEVHVPCMSLPMIVPNADILSITDSGIVYRCSEGFTTDSSTVEHVLPPLTMDCDHSNGRWTRPSWKCTSIDCGTPPMLDNTTRRYQTTTYGSGALYLCQDGFAPTTAAAQAEFAMSTCQADGQWSQTDFTCRYVDCGPPYSPLHPGVNVTYDHTYFKSVARMHCSHGYSPYSLSRDTLLTADWESMEERSQSMTCQKNGSWTQLDVDCVPDACQTIPQVLNARQTSVTSPVYGLGSVTVHSLANYVCLEGYQLAGGSQQVCYWNNTWSANDIQCIPEIIPCHSPPYIPSAEYEVFEAQPEEALPMMVFYRCQQGYLPTGVAMANCTSGLWSELTLTCNPISCGPPPEFVNADVYYVSTEHHSDATYHCKSGYDGEAQVWLCNRHGHWTGQAPVCQVSGCEAPLPVLNSYLQIEVGNQTSDYIPVLQLDHSRYYAVGTVVRYQCANGLVRIGGSTRTCQPAQVWSGRSPRCLKLTCPSIGPLENGEVNVTGYTVGSAASFHCHTGYALAGAPVLRCGPGRWSGPVPQCVHAVPDVMVESVMSRGQRRNRNATVHAYVGTERAYLRCMVLSGMPEPRLRWSRITGQQELDGKLREQRTKDGSLSLRIIFKPVQLHHAGVWRCTARNEHGQSHTDVEVFVYVSCAPPPSVTSGHFVSLMNAVGQHTETEAARSSSSVRTQYFFNEQISYHCHSGHVLVGTDIRTCMADGTWSGATSACFRRNCGKPAVPRSGHMQGSAFRFGDSVQYSCDDGHRLLGSKSRRCLATGKWSGSAPSCRIVHCGPPPAMENTETVGNAFVFGSVLRVECSTGYVDTQQEGNSGSLKCNKDGQWHGRMLNCTLVQCTVPASPRNGRIEYSDTAIGTGIGRRPISAGRVLPMDSCIQYQCNPGYSLVRAQPVRCCSSTARWTGSAPTCQAWCDAVSCGRGEKCVADLHRQRAYCTCLSEESDCRLKPDRPVCGSDGVTYATQCSMDAQACRHANTTVYVERTGPCSSLYESQRHCQCSLLVREPMLLDCFSSSWTMFVRIVAAHGKFYRVYVYKVYRMGRIVLEDKRIYKLHRVTTNNGCSCPSLQVGHTYLLSGLEGHNADGWDSFHLIVTSYSYARQQVYPRDLGSIQWPCT
ncbi:sushi, von Willebrand factor type A, EGF and pentraxin domain-containing protein 1-like isoform X1 [Sycon ciliatum]|uniref:sushi, von Willebrand factor type A, EGF and pentraxin domain-containing protein 1-like isoform X1 n=1 Tax=Sycon ciliatum TaxID=27933 RepID=UPI0031F64646